MRAALGTRDVIRLDSNMQWSLNTAIRVHRAIEPYDIRDFEDPVAIFAEMVALRRYSSMLFSSHVPGIRWVVRMPAPDFIVTNCAVLGGIARAVRFIGARDSMGLEKQRVTTVIGFPSPARDRAPRSASGRGWRGFPAGRRMPPN